MVVTQIRRTAALLVLASVLGWAVGAGAASARSGFRPQIGRAMGLVPIHGRSDPAQGTAIPLVYHGGSVMSGTVTVHTIFWAPSGYRFDGSPGAGALGYEALVQRFFTDVAHDSGTTGNVFSVLGQFGSTGVAGTYSIAYSAGADSIDVTDPYPAATHQCASPAGAGTCLTDAAIGREIDHVIATSQRGAGYGLHDLWQIFLPPGVDECTSATACGSNAYAGYHSIGDVGHGEFVYAVMIDPLVEGAAPPGTDPQGNPEAERTLDTAAHETVEAITDPEGVGWMDPNGFEVGDKCENGPQQGIPLGYASNGAAYDQLINGRAYQIQEMWSNAGTGACVQSSTATANALPLPRIALRQFSPAVSGSIGLAKAGVAVHIGILRGIVNLVASGVTRTRADGSWGPVTLRGAHGAPHGVGDDRDLLLVDYGRGGPKGEAIATGSGGSPFTEAGWTSWLNLDTGFQITSRTVAVSPCGQVGVLSATVNGRSLGPLVPHCQVETDATSVPVAVRVTPASHVVLTSSDNRAVSLVAPNGALVAMSVVPGEPDSVSAIGSSLVPFSSTGLPACTADLRLLTVSCSGLVPGERYTVRRARGGTSRHGRAGVDGAVSVSGFPGVDGVAEGDRFTLRGAGGQLLTTLHVAHLRAVIHGTESALAGGRCEPGDYVGAPLTSAPASASIGSGGATGRGEICPDNGHAARLPDAVLSQVDDLSGGVTRTSVPQLTGTTPAGNAVVPSAFPVLAQTGVTGSTGRVFATAARVSVAFYRGGSHRPVWRAANVASSGGVPVSGLAAGVYHAVWVLSDVNGDTRTVHTTFVVA